jgi:2',3'-cyclic-nucleotide 2'-phosphodiesterase (5'-nucleotidase family)
MLKKSCKSLHLFFLAAILFIGCKTAATVSKIEPSAVQLNAEKEEDKAILAMIEPYKSTLEKEMTEVLIVSEDEAVKGQPEGKLGNLIADITLARTNEYLKELGLAPADICMLNNGGLRTSLPKGDISMGKIFELMPFENMIVVLTMNGAQTQEMFNYIGRANGVPLAGARLKIVNEQPKEITINGVPFDANKSYRIVTSDYLAGGGDKMRFFNEPLEKKFLNRKLREAIAEYMLMEGKKGNKLQPKLDQRITSND